MRSAREWNADNLLRFTWSGDRLTGIRAFRKDSSTPYYQRTISYSGTMIPGESYNQGSKTGQIKYVYSGKVLQQVKWKMAAFTMAKPGPYGCDNRLILWATR